MFESKSAASSVWASRGQSFPWWRSDKAGTSPAAFPLLQLKVAIKYLFQTFPDDQG